MAASTTKPRIVFLNAGGTIMSEEVGDISGKTTGMPDVHDNEKRFRKLIDQCRDVYRQKSFNQYEFIYAPIPSGGPRLSEYACVGYWNDIIEGLQQVADAHEGALAGVILLHGTDTMSYLAPLLLFRCLSLTFPIVLTGANSPPRLEDGVTGFDFSTDAWENIHSAILFIDRYGKDMPGVYVAFASRICAPINLRKVRRLARNETSFPHIGQPGDDIDSHQERSPRYRYRFENINILSPYLARIIGNDVIFSPLKNAVEHVYSSIFSSSSVSVFSRIDISQEFCFLLKVSPGLPWPFSPHCWGADAKQIAPHLPDNLSVVILEGYKSGTLPTEGSNSIRDFILHCNANGISVVLTTRYGLEELEYQSVEDFPWLIKPKMFISETALAAAFHVVDVVEENLRGRDDVSLTFESQLLIQNHRTSRIRKRILEVERRFAALRGKILVY